MAEELGEVQFHWGALLGRPARDAEAAFGRALALDSTSVPAMVHLARIAASDGRHARLDSLRARVGRLAPGTSEQSEVELFRAMAAGTAADRARVSARVAQEGHAAVARAAPLVAAGTEHPAAVLPLARTLDEPSRATRERALARVLVAQLELARGRWRAAAAALDGVATLSAAMGARSARRSAADSSCPPRRRSWRRCRPRSSARRWCARRRAGSLGRRARRHLPGAALAPAGAARAAPRRPDPRAGRGGGPAPPHARAIWDSAAVASAARLVPAGVARQRGDVAAALRALGEPPLPLDRLQPRVMGFVSADERFLRAELLREAGREAEALRWYETFPDPSGYDLIYAAPAHLARARVHERRGERAAAADQYRRFAALWADCDPELRPLVDDARRRLAALATVRQLGFHPWPSVAIRG